MKTCYLSGPMTGLPDFNYPAFHEAAAKWAALGWVVRNPADNFGGRTDLPKEVYMEEDIRAVLASDAVVMLDNWLYSPGAVLEHNVGSATGAVILYDHSPKTPEEVFND